MHNLQQVIVVLLARNPNHDGNGQCNNTVTLLLMALTIGIGPPIYDEDNREEDDYTEDVLGRRRGLIRDCVLDNLE